MTLPAPGHTHARKFTLLPSLQAGAALARDYRPAGAHESHSKQRSPSKLPVCDGIRPERSSCRAECANLWVIGRINEAPGQRWRPAANAGMDGPGTGSLASHGTSRGTPLGTSWDDDRAVEIHAANVAHPGPRPHRHGGGGAGELSSSASRTPGWPSACRCSPSCSRSSCSMPAWSTAISACSRRSGGSFRCPTSSTSCAPRPCWR